MTTYPWPLVMIYVTNGGILEDPLTFPSVLAADNWIAANEPWEWETASARLFKIEDGKLIDVKTYTK
jgi:hypothetical protein